jgi:hypothetical protein
MSHLKQKAPTQSYSPVKKLLKEDNYADYENFFRQMFEIARRHKIMNPEKMRTEYGKLVYLLQDAVSPEVQQHLSFSCKVSMRLRAVLQNLSGDTHVHFRVPLKLFINSSRNETV